MGHSVSVRFKSIFVKDSGGLHSSLHVRNEDATPQSFYGARFFRVTISGIKKGGVIHYSSIDPVFLNVNVTSLFKVWSRFSLIDLGVFFDNISMFGIQCNQSTSIRHFEIGKVESRRDRAPHTKAYASVLFTVAAKQQPVRITT
jgi:hypothetical protein